MNKQQRIVLGIIIAAAAVGLLYWLNGRGGQQGSSEYAPRINPADFSAQITNPYFSLPVGKTFVYEGKTADGIERVEISIPGDTREIMGVETLVYRDIVTLDGQVVEDTRDYLAEDREGNVWYFGEDVDNYKNGVLADHGGSWIAGSDGAQPGIWMKARPKVGETYRQEYYAGEAEDMADVVSVSETVVTKSATYQNCLQTYDYTPLDPDAREYKYYCPEVGGLVLEVNLIDNERVELVEISESNVPAPQRTSEATDNALRGSVINEKNRMDLSGRNLERIPENVFSRTELESLDVSNNRLSGAIQAEIRHLRNLKVLNASDNQLTGIPAEIGQLVNLEVLDFSDNELTGLPYELGNLKNLRIFDISGNEYSEQDLEIISERLPHTVNIITQ